MRIGISALVDDPVQKSGVGQVVANVLAELQALDSINEYFVFTFNRDPIVYQIKKENFKNLQSKIYRDKSIKRILWNQSVLQYHILKNKIDLLHIPVSELVLSKVCPTVVSIEDLAEYNIKNKYSHLRMLYRKITLPITTRRVDHIITVSNSSKNDIVKFLKTPPDKISVIYHGVNERFRTLDKKEAFAYIQRKYNFTEKYLLYVGRLAQPSKNIVRIIQAFHQLKLKKNIKHKLVLIGKKDLGYENIIKAVKELTIEKEVLFIGYVPNEELPFFYNCASVFIYPSLYEGFGLPIIEAMACGLPVVASNVSSIPEVVGDAGLLVNPYNSDEIEKGIYSILFNDHLRGELIQKGLQRSKLFSWGKTAKGYIKVYERVLNSSRAAC